MWCPGKSSCIAVGDYADDSTLGMAPLVERWNGRHWSIMQSPSVSGQLNGISCMSRVGCIAVGYYSYAAVNSTLVEHWNGTRWSIVRSPSVGDIHSELDSIACVTSSNCMAVGYHSTLIGRYTLIEHWNGSRWSIVPSQNSPSSILGPSNALAGVACAPASNCTAVGDGSRGGPLTEHWNGSKWSIVNTPKTHGELEGVVCRGASACWAVGYRVTHGADTATLVEHWNGKVWSVVRSPG